MTLKKVRFLFLSIFLISCGYISEKKSIEGEPIKKVEKNEAKSNSDSSLSSMVLKADLFYGNNEYDSAVILYKKIIKLDSLNGKYYYRLGYSHSQLNRDVQAVVYFERSAKLGYEVFDSYRTLGIIYALKFSDKAKGMEYFKKCLEIDPKSKDIKTLVRTSIDSKGVVNL